MSNPAATPRWRKSSRSGGGGNQCVELACTEAGGAVRDSKNPAGPVLTVRLGALVSAVKEGQFG